MEPTADQDKTTQTAPKRKLWVYVSVVLLLGLVFFYISYLKTHDNYANHDFYRVLYEATNRFNENLSQLNSMLVNEESASAIRSLLPSYKIVQRFEGDETKSGLTEGQFRYHLSAQNLTVDARRFQSRLVVRDILPYPSKGFSQFLFADRQGLVVASIGGEKTISIVDLNTINQEIAEQRQRYRLNLKQQEGTAETETDYPVPSYSNHVDMHLSHGEYRIYIFPFSLASPLQRDRINQQGKTETSGVNQLYLIGLLPKEYLNTRDTGHWNLSLLLVTVISLFFMWTLMRVFMLPKSQSITPSFRTFTMLSAYSFFIVVIALTLAFMQKTMLQQAKDEQAKAYAKSVSDALGRDLREAFDGLSSYKGFYHDWLEQLDQLVAIRELGSNKKNADYGAYRMSLAPDREPASEEFQSLVTRVLKRSSRRPCSDIRKGLVPAYVWSEQTVFPVVCSQQGQPQVSLDAASEELVVDAYQKDTGGVPVMGMMAGNLTVEVSAMPETGIDGNQVLNSQVESYLKAGYDSYLPNNLLTVFSFSGAGNTILPSINYQESNAPPRAYNLSHREYYKNVRDYRGWDLFCDHHQGDTLTRDCRYSNVYIQRLLNINDGTRGTTISMPMYDGKAAQMSPPNRASFTLGADVILPSVSLAPPSPQDFTYMVVDRNTGEVLFHTDEGRTLVENLFYSGNHRASLTRWIKAGLDSYPVLGSGIVEGNYHGQPGRFVVHQAPVDAWAVVVFYPNDSLDALMTNLFLFIFVSFSLSMLLLVALLLLTRKLFETRQLKAHLNLPDELSGRSLIMAVCIILSVTYSLFAMGILLDLIGDDSDQRTFAFLLPLIALIVHLMFLKREYNQRYQISADDIQYRRPISALIMVIGVCATLHLGYLFMVAPMPYKGLAFHYNQLHCNAINHEREEINRMALSRFPNSISKHRRVPAMLMPLSHDYRQKILGNDEDCLQHSTQVSPADYPRLGTMVGATYLWQWINAYLASDSVAEDAHLKDLPSISLSSAWIFGFCLLLILIICSWVGFNRRVVWTRLYCQPRFLAHIRQLTRSEAYMTQDARSPNLVIECDSVKLNGIGLALLLRSVGTADNKHQQATVEGLLPGFATLYKLSPCLQTLSEGDTFLPNLKMNLRREPGSLLLAVELWDIETCLENSEYRRFLLNVILELKSLTLAGRLASLTIFTGFHSLQRVKMKDPLTTDESRALEHAEYLSWAECLMDFNVKLPPIFKRGLDSRLLADETAAMPELAFLGESNPDAVQPSAPPSIWKSEDLAHIEGQWTTLNYVLLHAEALYRFKWESCSNAEKLALYNLAKGQRMNPMNTQMIEHLALNGLICVNHDHIKIVNQSFAHFVLNAETAETLNTLIKQGENGAWKTYKLPIGLLVLLVIGGIAITSGESVYIIAASVAGIIGTIASVTSGAAMLRNQLRG